MFRRWHVANGVFNESAPNILRHAIVFDTTDGKWKDDGNHDPHHLRTTPTHTITTETSANPEKVWIWEYASPTDIILLGCFMNPYYEPPSWDTASQNNIPVSGGIWNGEHFFFWSGTAANSSTTASRLQFESSASGTSISTPDDKGLIFEIDSAGEITCHTNHLKGNLDDGTAGDTSATNLIENLTSGNGVKAATVVCQASDQIKLWHNTTNYGTIVAPTFNTL